VAPQKLTITGHWVLASGQTVCTPEHWVICGDCQHIVVDPISIGHIVRTRGHCVLRCGQLVTTTADGQVV
jgi:hypothetical protein